MVAVGMGLGTIHIWKCHNTDMLQLDFRNCTTLSLIGACIDLGAVICSKGKPEDAALLRANMLGSPLPWLLGVIPTPGAVIPAPSKV